MLAIKYTTLRPFRINGMEWWNGILEWNVGISKLESKLRVHILLWDDMSVSHHAQALSVMHPKISYSVLSMHERDS